VPDEGNAVVIPATLIEQLTEALAKWDGRGSTPDDDFEAGKRMASAIMALLVWNNNAAASIWHSCYGSTTNTGEFS
jgi:hypothetical protein